MGKKMTLDELMHGLDQIGLVEATLGDDNDGQLIVYTNLKLVRENEKEYLVPFEEE